MYKLLICFLFLSLTGCTETPEPESEPEVKSMLPSHIEKNFQMVWNDEFEGTTVDLKKWNYRAEGTLRNYATVSRNTISLDGKGNVSIKVTKDANGKYYVGQLGTQGIYETTYGYFECRAKMNRSLGRMWLSGYNRQLWEKPEIRLWMALKLTFSNSTEKLPEQSTTIYTGTATE